MEFHNDLDREGAIETIIDLSILEDVECQEYSAFSLAHLSSNRDFQVQLVDRGAVRPLVAMMSADAEPKHYAGLALLKLADNFENHLKIAEEGGIQALLRLGRTRTTDDQLQYKASLTLGQLATNAIKMLPNNTISATLAATTKINNNNKNKSNSSRLSTSNINNNSNNSTSISLDDDGVENGDKKSIIGHGSRVMNRLRSQIATANTTANLNNTVNNTANNIVNVQKNNNNNNSNKHVAKDLTIEFLNKSLADTQKEAFLLNNNNNNNKKMLKNDAGKTTTPLFDGENFDDTNNNNNNNDSFRIEKTSVLKMIGNNDETFVDDADSKNNFKNNKLTIAYDKTSEL
jgi:hypothetical protein